jgi:aryl-alcohol dehydrogenase-like predicted oxidoreductase
VQALINAVDLQAYHELKPVVKPFGLGLLAAAPLARGLLSGKYGDANPPPPGHPLQTGKGIGYWNERGRAVAERVREVARELNLPPVHIALGVLLSFPEVDSLLVGLSSGEQLIQCSQAARNSLDKSSIRYVLKDADQVE